MSFANNINNTVGTLGVSRGGTNLTATPTNGQLPIGNGTDFTLSTLTAGSNITITNSSGSITIASSGGGSGFTSIVTQVFTSGGTYTPTSGMNFCIVEVVGGGGGSGGIQNTSGTGNSGSWGGGGGGYARKVFASATIGASQVVTIGAGGTAGAAGLNNGGNGGTSSLGSLITATGGTGSLRGAAVATAPNVVSNPTIQTSYPDGGIGTLGDINIRGHCGWPCYTMVATNNTVGGNGGGSFYCGGGIGAGASPGAGNAGNNYGGGAGGAANDSSEAARAGAAGAAGIVIVTEFIT